MENRQNGTKDLPPLQVWVLVNWSWMLSQHESMTTQEGLAASPHSAEGSVSLEPSWRSCQSVDTSCYKYGTNHANWVTRASSSPTLYLECHPSQSPGKGKQMPPGQRERDIRSESSNTTQESQNPEQGSRGPGKPLWCAVIPPLSSTFLH